MSRLDYDTPVVHQVKTIELLRLLSKQNIISVRVLMFLSSALVLGGYISGGFATSLYRTAFYSDLGYKQNPFMSIEIYLARGGDIDIFFPNESMLQRFLERSPNLNVGSGEKMKNCVLWKIDRATVQVIKCKVAPAMMMFKTFDISNACIAFFENQAIHLSGFQELTLSRELHIQMWTKATLLRIKKWFSKQNPFFSMLSRECNQDFLRVYKEHLAHPEISLDDGYGALVDEI